MKSTARPAVDPTKREAITEIRRVLDGAGFDEPSVLTLLGEVHYPSIRRRVASIDKYLELADGGSPLEILVRLFVLRQNIGTSDFAAAIAPMEPAAWISAGLVTVNGDRVIPAVELCPYRSIVAAADWPGEPRSADDEVMDIAASSRALLQMTIRQQIGSVLDIGSGCGIQSIAAAEHSRSVLGTDISRRAVRFAEFNSILNGRTNASFAAANLFDAAKERTFDLIVCNPPFVIGPKALSIHTSTGTPSDTFCETIIRRTPEFMNPNGYAQLVCNWAQIGDESSEEHISNWLENNGCDSWVLHSHTESAAEYARARAEENASDPDRVEALFSEWIEYFLRENITGVHFGVITMRRSAGHANWIRYDELPKTNGDCGDAIRRGFLLQDFLEQHSIDRDLLDQPISVAPEVELVESPADHDWHVQLKKGLMFSANINPEISEFLHYCESEMPPRNYVLGQAFAKGFDVQKVLPRFESAVCQLIKYGFLMPIMISGQV